MASTNRPEYTVTVEDGPGWITDSGVGPSFRWQVFWTEPKLDIERLTCGEARTRHAAWACALAALKGAMHLERSRH